MYAILKVFAFLLALLPTPLLDGLTRLLTFILFDILRLRRGMMIKNLGIAFGDQYSPAEKTRIARAAFRNFLQTIFETFISHRFPIDAKVSVENREVIDEALAEDKGVFILCMHMGNWEAMGAAVTHQIRPSYAAMKKVGSPGVNRFVEELREKNGLHWIKRKVKGDAYRQMIEILGRKEIVGLVMDQARPGEPRLPFFSQDAKTNTSMAAIWQKQKAPIVVSYIVRKKFGEHSLKFGPRIHPVDTNDLKADVIRNSILFNQAVEEAVRQYPEHYFWFHNRWK